MLSVASVTAPAESRRWACNSLSWDAALVKDELISITLYVHESHSHCFRSQFRRAHALQASIQYILVVKIVNLLQQTLLVQVVGDDLDGLLDAGLLAVNVDLGVLGSLVGSADTSELLDLTGASLLVQTLGVALLGLLHGNVNEDLDEGKRSLAVLGVGVEVTGDLAVGLVGGDEGGKGDGGAVGEELGDLLRRVSRESLDTQSIVCLPRRYA
jgi:hypothetical protein